MISYFCIIIALFIPIICAAYAKFSQKGYDNRHPREFLNRLEGKGQRANFAQLNSWEAFAPFGIGILAAHQLGANEPLIDIIAIIFITARIAYCMFYILDQHLARSVTWSVGFISTLTLFIIGL